MKIVITQEAFTGLIAIRLNDELTHQVLLVAPDELPELIKRLIEFEPDKRDDPMAQRESRRMRGLTLYNLHSLPSVNRPKFEAKNYMTCFFSFEVEQVITNEHGEEIERQKVGTL